MVEQGREDPGHRPQERQGYRPRHPPFCRPAEVDILIGDPGKTMQKLNWKRETNF